MWSFVPLLLQAVAAAQDPSPASRTPLLAVEPVDFHRPEAGLEVQQTDQHYRLATWHAPGAPSPIEIPLARPVQDLAAALSADGKLLVLLAGGVRSTESLDVYLVAADGSRRVFETRGGSRLPETFNDGLGSWPLVEGRELALFAYEKEGRLEVRAFDLSGQLHATRTFAPAERARVRGFRAGSDASNEVRVDFAAEFQPLVFPHPAAPRVELSDSLLDFGPMQPGRASSRTFELHNTGRRSLHARLQVQAPFAVVGELERTVLPGASVLVRVAFAPLQPGALQERLRVLSDASNPEFVVALRGEGIAAAVPAEPAPAGMPAPPVEAEPDTEPAPPLVDVCVLERLEGDHLRVAGSVRPVAGVRLRAQVDGGGAAEVLPAADGSFVVEVTGTSAARVTLLAVGSRGLVSAPVEVGQVLPAIAQTGDQLEVRGPAGAEFALLAVVVGDDGRRVLHVLSQWRGSIGPDGKRTLDTAAFRGGATPVTLVAVLQVDGVRRRSNLLQLQK